MKSLKFFSQTIRSRDLIYGIYDADSVQSDTSLGDLGLDSLMGVEVKQILERSLDINLSMKEIRQLTVNSLRKLSKRDTEKINIESVNLVDHNMTLIAEIMPTEILVPLNNNNNPDTKPLYIIYPIEGIANCLLAVAGGVTCPVYGLQCTRDVPLTSIQDMASYYLQIILRHNAHKNFDLAGYSFGSTVAIEIANLISQSNSLKISKDQQGLMLPESQLEDPIPPTNESDDTRLQFLILLDGSHKVVMTYTKAFRDQLEIKNKNQAENEALVNFVEKVAPDNMVLVKQELQNTNGMNNKLQVLSAILVKNNPTHNTDDVKSAALSYYQKLIVSEKYNLETPLKRHVTLIKAEHGIGENTNLGEDYGLGEIFTGTVKIHTVPGNHTTFIEGTSAEQVANIINTIFSVS